MAYKKQHHTLELIVVAGEGPTLMGRDWLSKIQLDWNELYYVNHSTPPELQVLLDKYQAVFRDELGTV